MPQMDLRSPARIAARIIVWLATALLLLVLSWVLSNLHDIDPAPRPAALVLAAPQLAENYNAFFALVGLHAGADRDPATVGKTLWRLRLEAAKPMLKPRGDAASEAIQRLERQAVGAGLPDFPGLLCDPSAPACIAQWIAQADELTKLRLAHTAVGTRCEQWIDDHCEFEEVLAPMRGVAEPMAQHGVGASHCSRWLLSSAVLAWTQARPADAVTQLIKADRLNRALMAGSRSLIGQMLALRQARNTLNVIAALTVRDARMATSLASLLAPWPDQSLAVRRWMTVEAAFQQGTMNEVSAACRADPGFESGNARSAEFESTLFAWLCRHRIGWHPERMRAAIDEHWLREIERIDLGLASAIPEQQVEGKATESAGALSMLSWRNTLGNAILAVGKPLYTYYVARHADLELQRTAVELVLHAIQAGVNPNDLAARTARQTQPSLAQGRLSWDAEGRTLSARTWQQEYAGGVGFNAERDAIRITLPKP